MAGKPGTRTVHVEFDEFYPYPNARKEPNLLSTPIEVSESEAKFLLSVDATVDRATRLIKRKLEEQVADSLEKQDND